MVDMCELEEAFESQKGGKRMTEIGTVKVVDVLSLYERLKSYQREVESLEKVLTSPRRRFNCWGRICRERRLNKLTGQLIPQLQLQAKYPG